MFQRWYGWGAVSGQHTMCTVRQLLGTVNDHQLRRLRRPMIGKQTHDRGHFSYAGVDHGEDSRNQDEPPEQSTCTYTTDDPVGVSDDYLACRNDGAAEHGHGERFEVSFRLLREAQPSHAALVRPSSSKAIRGTLVVRRVSIFGIGVGVHLLRDVSVWVLRKNLRGEFEPG